ncbi:MAG: tRNA (guanosine(18)-2'-O)-methyltransferase TrmH [Candidatus Eremiobacteraeota bacterium]|nr:tRNA (guanosine(18)-2'-O)-methyltransferase TrmH [Candidatus Eremiobacteraeota bacterium]
MTKERFARLHKALSQRQPDLTVLLDGVHKAWNLSAVFRTAEAVGLFEVHAVFDQDIEPELSKAHSSGVAQWVGLRPHRQTEKAIEELKTEGFQVVGVDLTPDAIDFRAYDYSQPTALVMGAEKFGLTPTARRLVDRSLVIPMMGLGVSLNVSVAAAIVLYEAQRQRVEAGLYRQSRLSTEVFQRILFEWAYPEVTVFCKKEGLPYPIINEEGEIPDRVGGLSLAEVRAQVRQQEQKPGRPGNDRRGTKGFSGG